MGNTFDFFIFLNHWIFVPEIWIILGIIIILIDLLIGLDYIILPFGIACFITSGLVALNNSDYIFTLMKNTKFEYIYLSLETWQDVLYLFAVLSVLSVLLMRYFSKGRPKDSDINEY
jgi:membrane protein implicated in regulation of membrane protease activity